MENFREFSEQVHQVFETLNQARDNALLQARQLTRLSAQTIRAIHRSEMEEAARGLEEAGKLAVSLKEMLAEFQQLFYAGYTQDALKEFAEASITYAVINNEPLPTPASLNIDYATYLNGLAEVTGELRRRCLDILRQGYSRDAERLLG